MKNSELLATLNQYKEEGKLYSQVHPTLPLTIWNYTPEVQYKGLWDNITLMCRGLVTDDTGRIRARPFQKFFNLEEGKHKPTDEFEVFEKLDGSLIIVFWYAGEMVVASRGSFTSPHAKTAEALIKNEYPKFQIYAYPYTTYCFELIGFEQIVVKYDATNLILTGRFEESYDQSWTEVSLHTESIQLSELKRVRKFNGLDWKTIKDLNWNNAEGFVVRFSNGSRCKIKFEDYIRLHRVMTKISEKKIWEALKDGTPISSILKNVPDEFFDEVKQIEDDLIDKFLNIEKMCRVKFRELSEMDLSRKEFAQLALKTTYSPAILFSMLDKRDYSQQIWKILEP